MRIKLIELLADGEVHSGADLARILECSRTAIWKQLRQLRSVDLEVEAKPGRGYRLTRPIELLDRNAIRARLEPRAASSLGSLEIIAVTDSTNDVLRTGPAVTPGRMHVAFAEYQTGGRGRRGRRWLSPFGSGLCMSAGWTFPVMPPTLPALSLAAGVAVHRALGPWSPAGLGLKWPNDIVADGAKLGGLLIDVQGESDGPVSVVIGVGINIDPVADLADRFDTDDSLPPVGLRSLVRDAQMSRNEVAAAITNCLLDVLPEFQATGFESFADEWRRCDAMKGAPIRLRVGEHARTGVAVGIGDDGALLFNDGEAVRSVLSGEVTMRHAATESSV